MPADGDVDEQTKALVRRAQFLRGQIVNSYAQVEFLLADLAVKAAKIPEYRALVRNFPYRLTQRIAAVKRMAAGRGPLSRYEAEVVSAVDAILGFEELRHFMVHGLLVITTRRSPHKNATSLNFADMIIEIAISPSGSGKLTLMSLPPPVMRSLPMQQKWEAVRTHLH